MLVKYIYAILIVMYYMEYFLRDVIYSLVLALETRGFIILNMHYTK